MELSTRPRHDAQSERCPYCHDQLEDEVGLVRVECPGCGTRHHRVCIQELGRCSVFGCEHPIDISAIELELEQSKVLRVIRQRYRERARRFAQRNVRDLPGRVAATIAEAREHSEAGRFRESAAVWDEVYELLRRPEARSDPAVVRAAEGITTRDCVLKRQEALDAHFRAAVWKIGLLLLVTFGLPVLGLILMWVINGA